MLKPPDNLKEICFYAEHINFPIVIFICSEWEKTQLSYLDSKNHSTETLAKWCINHKISYQIIYPLNIKSFLKNPKKTIAYIKLVKKH